MNSSLREKLKSGPLHKLYRILRNANRRLRGKQLEGSVSYAIRFPLASEFNSLLTQFPNCARLHYSLALALKAEQGSEQEAWDALCQAFKHGFESSERLALYFAYFLAREGRQTEAIALLEPLAPYEFTEAERKLRQDILAPEPVLTDAIPTAFVETIDLTKKVPVDLLQPYKPTVTTRSATPRVSIIVPNYNYARYLKERLRSLLAQTYTDFELLYFDDASKDESNQVASLFASDPRMEIHLHKENSGSVYKRRAEHIAMAKGEWIWIADADDSADPEFLSTLLGLADRHPTAGILHCQMMTIDSSGVVMGMYWGAEATLTQHLSADYFAAGCEEAVVLSSGCFMSSSAGMLIKREALIKTGGFDPRLKLAADWDLYLRILQFYDVAYCSVPLFAHRHHQENVTKLGTNLARVIEDAFCVASVYLWIRDDPRLSQEEKTKVLRRLKGRIFDMFVVPPESIPSEYKFAIDIIYRAIPDMRLKKLVFTDTK